MKIYGIRDLKIAYDMLRYYEDMYKNHRDEIVSSTEKVMEHIIRLKREIRAYTNAPVLEGGVLDNDFDGAIAVKPLPDNLTSEESANGWFMENEYMDRPNSMYDCTGQMFTVWYKIFKRRGKYWVYHCFGIDV